MIVAVHRRLNTWRICLPSPRAMLLVALTLIWPWGFLITSLCGRIRNPNLVNLLATSLNKGKNKNVSNPEKVDEVIGTGRPPVSILHAEKPKVAFVVETNIPVTYSRAALHLWGQTSVSSRSSSRFWPFSANSLTSPLAPKGCDTVQFYAAPKRTANETDLRN